MKKILFYVLIYVIYAAPLVLEAQVANAPVINTILNGNISEDKTNLTLEGATIQIKGTTNISFSDKKGRFTLKTGQKLPFAIVVSYSGYQPIELVVSDEEVNVKLKPLEVGLDELVVTGYSNQSLKTYSGSVSKISAAGLSNRPTQSFTQLLGGQAAGVDIVQPSGVLNSTPVLRIRGINSISSSIYPLVVIDGVTVFTGSGGGSLGNDPLSDINPNDIESVDILKDASATSIYGSRAANGVLVITTKKGRKGKTKVNYNSWVSTSSPFNLPKILSANDYVTIKNEARTNAGLSAGFALSKNADGSDVNTNWYDVAYQNGISQNHDLSFSGANESTNYFASANYTDQNGILRTSEFKKTSFRLNLSHKLNSKIQIGTNFTYSNSVNKGPNSGATPPNSISSASGNSVNTQFIGLQPLARLTYILPPNVPIYNADGSYNINKANGNIGYGANSPSLGVFNAYNLQTILDLDKNISENNKFLGNVFGEWQIINGLKFKTSYGLDRLAIQNIEFRNPNSGDGFSSNGQASNSITNFTRSDWTNTLSYQTNIRNKHNFNLFIGHEEIARKIEGWGATRTGLADPFYTSYQGGWLNITPSSNLQTKNGLISYFSNLNYDYGSKYLFSLNFRRDGLSSLAPGNKWGDFGGGSVGWNVSEEKFFINSKLSKALDIFKLRLSYGIVGNSAIDDYISLSRYSSSTYAGLSALTFSQAGNTALKWERSKKFNAGFTTSIFDKRLKIELDYYKNTIDGLILNAPQSLSQGIPGNSIAANVGSLYNKGIEISLNSIIINKERFQWNLGLNFSTLENKVISLGAGGDIFPSALATFGIQNMTRVGYSVGSIFAVPSAGINPANGNRIFINRNNEKVQYDALTKSFSYLEGGVAPRIDNYLDGKIQGTSLPKYFGGLTNSFVYHEFELNLLITYSGGNKLYNGTKATLSDQRYFNNGTFILNRWQSPGQITDVPKLIWGDNYSSGFTSTNTAFVEDGSYVKLKNLVFSYRLPVKKSSFSTWISSARVYVQTSNIFTLTKYTGSDPEISINGNSINSGKDQNVPVNARVFTLGLNIEF